MNKRLSWVVLISFGIFWYVISLWIADPAIDRIFETYRDDFVIRFAALSTYYLCALATGNAYVNFVWGIRALFARKNK